MHGSNAKWVLGVSLLGFFFGDSYRDRAQRDQWRPSTIGKNLISPINDYGHCFPCEGTGSRTLECKVCDGTGNHTVTVESFPAPASLLEKMTLSSGAAWVQPQF